ncbi:MAG: NUDIX domain-containing protein [Planctomycetota bacterium]|nr:NUDIX domain-containing protein [Planctomycetota bacterium]
MPRAPIPTWFFALVICRLGRRYLVVHEAKHGQRWYLPAGRVEPGETLVEAAVRETLEEAGVPVVIDGVIRIEHTPAPDACRVRVIFSAHPADDTPPKTIPDEHSLEAAWRTLEELEGMQRDLRGAEWLRDLRALERGVAPSPLSVLGSEG